MRATRHSSALQKYKSLYLATPNSRSWGTYIKREDSIFEIYNLTRAVVSGVNDGYELFRISMAFKGSGHTFVLVIPKNKYVIEVYDNSVNNTYEHAAQRGSKYLNYKIFLDKLVLDLDSRLVFKPIVNLTRDQQELFEDLNFVDGHCVWYADECVIPALQRKI